MPEPYSWNAVVIGAWNLAILSPDGIRKRLFDLPDNVPIELEMAVDRPGQFRVGHNGVLVIPTSVSLEVLTRVPNAESLERACGLCIRTLRALPQTPVAAAGVNIRYRFAEVPDAVFDLVRAPIDATLSDAGFQVGGAETKRTLVHAPGNVTVLITHGGIGGTLEFNFHRDSVVPTELEEWLGRVQEFIALSAQIANTIGVADVRPEIHA